MLLGTVCALVALTGCSGRSAPDPPDEAPTAASTPLADYDTTGLTLARGGFCERVSESAITAALGAGADGTGSWEPGRRLPGSRDISNEFGCSWTAGSVTVRAWVFAPPITRVRAADFADELVPRRCEVLEGAPLLGEPGVAQRCDRAAGATLTGYYGLIADAWVGCEIDRGRSSGASAAEPEESVRVGEWCVAVLQALRAA